MDPEKEITDLPENETTDDRLPDYYEGRLWYCISTHFWKFIYISFISVLFSLPLVTIPAALCGLHAYVQRIYRRGYDMEFHVFFGEFKTDFIKRMLTGLPLIILPPAVLLLTLEKGGLTMYLATGVASVFSLVCMSWLYPQLALMRLGSLRALANAAILTFSENGKNLLLLIVQVVCMGLFLLLRPISYAALVFVFPGISALLVTDITLPVLKDRLVREDKKEKPEPSDQ